MQSFNEAAVLEVDGQVVPTDKIRYSYKKSGWGSDATSELPTEPGTYVQTAEIGGRLLLQQDQPQHHRKVMS